MKNATVLYLALALGLATASATAQEFRVPDCDGQTPPDAQTLAAGQVRSSDQRQLDVLNKRASRHPLSAGDQARREQILLRIKKADALERAKRCTGRWEIPTRLPNRR
jgi:hypothetical protein